MLRVFSDQLMNPENFVVTIELVPGWESFGASTNTLVFDLDSVLLTSMMKGLNDRMMASGDPEPFFTGCRVSPFKTLKSECLAQYKKLDKKIYAGFAFVITQLGYDINKFNELIR